MMGFPNVKLSYETNIHKKVYNSKYVVAIPYGKKYFAWFTEFKSENVCVLLEIIQNKQLGVVSIFSACFSGELSYGTIFYGTKLFLNGCNFFCVEDLYYYKGKNVSDLIFSEKLNHIHNIFSSEIKQVSYHKNMIVFGLPFIGNNVSDLVEDVVKKLAYKIRLLQIREGREIYNMRYAEENVFHEEAAPPSKEKNAVRTIEPKSLYKNEFKREKVFKVTADTQTDIYNLFNGDTFYDIAYIPTYDCSVMMNTLFRNIKENINLDSIEESDDEDEFENDKTDKFVHLDRSYDMVCSFNNKYKKWVPLRLV